MTFWSCGTPSSATVKTAAEVPRNVKSMSPPVPPRWVRAQRTTSTSLTPVPAAAPTGGSTTTDIGHRTAPFDASGMTGPLPGTRSWETQGPEEISIELATMRGLNESVRTVSPKTHTSRPSLSRALAPMSPACQAGREDEETTWLTRSAEMVGAVVGEGQAGSSSATDAVLGGGSESSEEPHPAASATASTNASTNAAVPAGRRMPGMLPPISGARAWAGRS